jgi:type II secretory pathway pseudopilin PulG
MLVVVVIISILAAIAVPIFFKQREKGYEAQIQSALKNAANAVVSYGTDHNGDYSGLHTASNPDFDDKLLAEGFKIPAYLTYLNVVVTGGKFCIEARHSLLTASSDWRRSTFREGTGGPAPTPDNCP